MVHYLTLIELKDSKMLKLVAPLKLSHAYPINENFPLILEAHVRELMYSERAKGGK